MKKITLSVLATVAMLTSGYSQAVYNIVAPFNDNSISPFRGPNGTANYAYQRSVMFIHELELLPMNLSTINSVSFQYKNGTGSIPVIGNFTLYLENTTDQDMLKPNSFSAISATMSPSYIGTYTVPGGTGASTISLQLTTAFTYTGGGLYVAWDFDSAGPFATAAATLASNSVTGLIYYNASPTAPVNTFTAGNIFRPSLIFNATNTATTELEVALIQAEGKISKIESTTQDVTAFVVNSSIGAQSNVTVGLTATGANPYSTSTVITSIPAGGIASVTFPSYAPTANGISTLVATVTTPDQDPTNNFKSWTQSVTCNNVAIPAAGKPVADYTQYTIGNGVVTAFMHTTGATSSSLTGISVIVPSFTNAGNLNEKIYPVLADANGVIIATGNTLTIQANNMDVLTNLTFPTSYSLDPNTPYLFGVGTTTTGYFPIGTIGQTFPVVTGYYQFPIGGGTPNPIEYGHLSLEATLSFSNTTLAASATRTRVCKNETTTLTVVGTPTSYVWTNNASSSTASSVIVTPTVANVNGGIATYVVSGTDPVTGCKTSNAVLSVSVSACTAIADNEGTSAISLYPNPATSGKATLSGLSGSNSISVYNTLGQLVLTEKATEETFSLDLSSQPAGNYIIKVTDSNDESRLLKMINQK
jgi:hypothetical protein